MKEIKATKGYYLTQSAEVSNRIFATSIKGENIKAEDWREATAEERDAYIQSHKKETPRPTRRK